MIEVMTEIGVVEAATDHEVAVLNIDHTPEVQKEKPDKDPILGVHQGELEDQEAEVFPPREITENIVVLEVFHMVVKVTFKTEIVTMVKEVAQGLEVQMTEDRTEKMIEYKNLILEI